MVFDISNPSNIQFESEIRLTRGAGYATFQDGYAHVGASDKYVKIDMRHPGNLEVVGSATTGIENRDEDFAVALGNLAIVSDDHADYSIIVPHQTSRDNDGPAVNMVIPEDGASDQALTTRVGLTFTDQVDLRTLDNSTFIVRPVGGDAPSGKYSTQTGIANFFLDQDQLPSGRVHRSPVGCIRPCGQTRA